MRTRRRWTPPGRPLASHSHAPQNRRSHGGDDSSPPSGPAGVSAGRTVQVTHRHRQRVARICAGHTVPAIRRDRTPPSAGRHAKPQVTRWCGLRTTVSTRLQVEVAKPQVAPWGRLATTVDSHRRRKPPRSSTALTADGGSLGEGRWPHHSGGPSRVFAGQTVPPIRRDRDGALGVKTASRRFHRGWARS